METINAIWQVVKKDFVLEFRTRYGLNLILLFVLISVSLVVFSFAGEQLQNTLLATLMWNTIFFSAMAALQRGFVGEAEQGTLLFLKISYPPTAIFFGKLIYNLLLALGINMLVALLYVAAFKLSVESYGMFALTMGLGSLATAIPLTLISAIVAGTTSRGSLFAVLSFPPILPCIWLVVRVTRLSTDAGNHWQQAGIDLNLLLAYSAVMLILGWMLFDYVLED